MKTAKVVIGAGFGDEGKGKIADYFASEYGKNCIVVRFNGGAQAGHTVVTPEGNHHIFHHFGSGSFTGAKTYLSKYFVVNPILFHVEHKELQMKGVNPIIYVDPRCIVSTPYDMLINQMVEEHRDKDKHGSCGIGFNETIERSNYPEFRITVQDLSDTSKILRTLRHIVLHWVHSRLLKFGITKIPDFYLDIMTGPSLIENYFRDIELFMSRVGRANEIFLYTEKNIIFEGAQGLMLDKRHHYFPHVTRSKTGLDNVLELVAETDIDDLDVTYVTRPYITRHGAGPLMHELTDLPYPGIQDTTNIYNNWQGGLRFAWLDTDILIQEITQDFKKANVPVQCNIAINCMDQIGDKVRYIVADKFKSVNGCIVDRSPEVLAAHLAKETNSVNTYIGTGPTRNDVEIRG